MAPTSALIIAALIVCCAARVSAAAAPLEIGALFAGLDPEFTYRPVARDVGGLDSVLVGVIVDGEEVGMELVYRQGDTYYLPALLLGRIGVQGRGSGRQLILVTPGGEVKADGSLFLEIDGRPYFSSALLDEVLKIRWEFSPQRYALNLTLPWWQRGVPGDQVVMAVDNQAVDVAPSSFGLTQARLDNTWYTDDNVDYYQSNLLLRGRMAEGIWRGEVIAREGQDVLARDYYWIRDFNHVQALAGNQEVLINPLVPAVETTGAQALYSSKSMPFDPYQDQTRSQYVRRFGIPARDIEGFSQPGAIAELRVNERPIARTRVKLDGSYRFDQVKSNSLQFQTVRVHILDQRSFVELDMQDFTRTPIDLLLDRRQTVVFGGVGANGNPLDPMDPRRGEAAFGLIRHGLTDSLTLEAGLQSAEGRAYQTAGVSASFGRNWAANASVAAHSGSHGYSLDLYGRADRWQLTGRSQTFEADFRMDGGDSQRLHEIRYEQWLGRGLSMGFQGRVRKLAGLSDSYLLPGLTWRFGRRNYAKVWPDYDGDYRVDVRTSHRTRDWFEFVHDGSGDRAEYRYYRSRNLEYFGRISNYQFANAVVGELGAIWYPNEYDDRSLLAASVLGGDGGAGYRLAWQTTVLPGLFSQLELRREPIGSEFYDPGLQLRWTVSLDFSFSGGRPVPARNDFTQSRLGAIAGRLTLPDGSPLDQGVDRVSILINGRPHTAVLNGRYFYVRGIVPGTYEVTLGSEYLPMSVSPQHLTFRVRVASAATSIVEFVVQHEYGMAGRITDAEGHGVGNVRVLAFTHDGTPVGYAYSDTYGYYRFTGLVPGTYRVAVATPDGAGPAIEVDIVDAFLFDADLTIRE